MRQQPETASATSLIDTAQFRKLLQIEPRDAGDNPDADDGRRTDYTDDLLAKTDKLRRLEVPESENPLEENPGFDPYNSAKVG